MLGFERVILISRWSRNMSRWINEWSWYSTFLKILLIFGLKHISFIKLVTVKRINASYLLSTPANGPLKLNRRASRLLGHLQYCKSVTVLFKSGGRGSSEHWSFSWNFEFCSKIMHQVDLGHWHKDFTILICRQKTQCETI